MNTKRYVILLGHVFNYEDKAPFVQSGQSIRGAIEYDKDNDKLKCHECGEWFDAIWSHSFQAHGIHSREYKVKHGLAQSASLVSQSARDNMRQRTIERIRSGTLKPIPFRKGSKRCATAKQGRTCTRDEQSTDLRRTTTTAADVRCAEQDGRDTYGDGGHI
jgi:hypothetical protein